MKTCLLMAALMFAPIPAVAQDNNVQIQLSNYKFMPSTLRLRAGEPVVLRLVNASTSTHSFDAPDFFAAARSVSGPVHNGDVMLEAHETAAIRITPAAGTYHVHCDRPFHAMFGMRGQIVVA
jgi:plastocyanin